MKVLILTEGGSRIGLGHLTRCIALSQAMREFIPQTVIKLVIQGDIHVKGPLLTDNIDVLYLDWKDDQNRTLRLVGESNVTIVDSYLAGKPLYDKVSDATDGHLLMLDDYNRIEYPKGIVVNPSIYGDKIAYSDRQGTIYLLGKSYVIVRKEFWEVPLKTLNKRVKDVLITFGGVDDFTFSVKIVEFLISNYKFDFHIVFLGNTTDSNCLLDDSERINLYYNLSAAAMRDLMLRCDMCISAGGQTLYELARIGVPTIGICLADNQVENLKTFEESGFLEYAGSCSDSAILDELRKAIKYLGPFEVRQKKNVIGKNLVDGKGVNRIVSNVMQAKCTDDGSLGITLRSATKEDCRDLWIWRNRPEIRKWCFHSKEIGFEDHKKWFEKKMEDEKVKIYISEDKDGEKIGQARFELDKDTAFISVNLNPRFSGKGLGNRLIRIATELFVRKNPEVKEVIAEIKDENISSKRAFEKAGYVFSHSAFREGKKKIAIFILKRIDNGFQKT